MTKEQIEKEAKAECFMLTVNTIGIDQRDVELAYILGRNKSIEQIKDLEKENTDLKAKYDTRLRENTGLKIHNAYVEKKLAEAKELLKRWERLYNTNTVKGIISDTEHFLKEE